MLYNFFISFDFRRFSQSGCYFDFFYKNLCEIFVRNVFIYTSQFFGEKYMIEGWTKKIFENCVFYLNSLIGWSYLTYFNFFLQIISFLFYFITLFNLITFFL